MIKALVGLVILDLQLIEVGKKLCCIRSIVASPPRINMIGIMYYLSFSRDLRDDRRLAHRVRDTV